MTGKELKEAILDLGWTQAKLARALSVGPNSVSRWVADRDGAVPGPIAAYVRVVLRMKEQWMEIDGA